MLVQPDGRIVIGGRFGSINGVTRSRLARLNSDGTLDGAFAAAVTGFVHAIAREADGSLLLAGNISAVNGIARSGLARVAAGGALDAAFSIIIDRPNAEWIEAVAVRGRSTRPSTRAPTRTRGASTTGSSVRWLYSPTDAWSSADGSCG